jgi:(p)ppGpp synthase/HD superfamily hydrolase
MQMPGDNADAALLLSRAVAIAARVHEKQKDKAGGAYILHPLRLMLRAESDGERMVAVLHDVVEDSYDTETPYDLERLRAEGFPPTVVEAVDLLTRRKPETHDGASESYDEFIGRILHAPEGAARTLALRVKLLDLEDNMTLTRLAALDDEGLERLRRYHGAHGRIKAALDAAGHGK